MRGVRRRKRWSTVSTSRRWDRGRRRPPRGNTALHLGPSGDGPQRGVHTLVPSFGSVESRRGVVSDRHDSTFAFLTFSSRRARVRVCVFCACVVCAYVRACVCTVLCRVSRGICHRGFVLVFRNAWCSCDELRRRDHPPQRTALLAASEPISRSHRSEGQAAELSCSSDPGEQGSMRASAPSEASRSYATARLIQLDSLFFFL